MNRRRRALALLLAVVVAACSSAAPSSSPTATPIPTPTPTPTPLPSPTIEPGLALIRDAALATLAEAFVRMDFEMTFEGNASVPEGTTLSGFGRLAFEEPKRLAMEMDFGGMGLGVIEMVINDNLIYMSGGFLEGALVGPGQWLVVDLNSTDPRATSFLSLTEGQNDFTLVMYMLFGAQGPVRQLQPSTIDGVASTHYGFTVDMDLAPDEAPDEVREHLLDMAANLRASSVSRTLDAEVWIGEDGLIHRQDLVYEVGRSGGGGTMHVVYDYSEFGLALNLPIPDETDVVRLEDLPEPSP